MQHDTPILDVRGLALSFTQYDTGFSQAALPVMQDLSLTIDPGQLVAVVGASGSGKSLLAHSILGTLPYNAQMEGTLLYNGRPLTAPLQKTLRGDEIVLVPQGVDALDPLMKIGPQVQGKRRGKAAKLRMLQVLARYGLGPEVAELYPFELSGGMVRRVLIATAVMGNPRLIVADEPTPGLHLAAAQRVLGHFREIADQGAGVLLITHDLELAVSVADRVVVFYAGTTVEDTCAKSFQSGDGLRHPYSKALWAALPQNRFAAVPGSQPYAADLPKGCAFAPRCPNASAACKGPIPCKRHQNGWVRCVL